MNQVISLTSNFPVRSIQPHPSQDVLAKIADLGELLPVVRKKSEELLKDFPQFRAFETYRRPERQAWYYGQGRQDVPYARPGRVITNAKPWQSFHQHRRALDVVLWDPQDGWHWGESSDYQAIRAAAQSIGFSVLSWEMPHLEWRDGFPLPISNCRGPVPDPLTGVST